MQNLQNIFDAITPDNIKDIPVIKDAMAVFIETLEELSKESIDIRRIFENPVIKEELVKIYLDDLYRVFKTLQFNQKVVEKIERLNSLYGIEYYKVDVILNIAKYINEEHFLTFKSYKEKKGTEDAIKYIYELVGTKLLSEDNKQPFVLTPIAPFVFNISGNLPSELYEAVVRPLAHPLGFVYQYDQLISLLLEDIFLSTITYQVNTLEVRCLLPDGSTQATNYKYELDGITPRVVVDLINTQTSTETIKKIVFLDGTYLEQVTTSLGQTHVYYKAANHTVITAYDVYQCSVYFDYTFILTTGVQEQLLSKVTADNSDTHPEVQDIYVDRNHFIAAPATPLSQSAKTIGYIDASTILIGTPGILIDHKDDLNNPYKIYGGYTDINEDNAYRYYTVTYEDADPVNLCTETDDIFSSSMTRVSVNGSLPMGLLSDNNYAAWNG